MVGVRVINDRCPSYAAHWSQRVAIGLPSCPTITHIARRLFVPVTWLSDVSRATTRPCPRRAVRWWWRGCRPAELAVWPPRCRRRRRRRPATSYRRPTTSSPPRRRRPLTGSPPSRIDFRERWHAVARWSRSDLSRTHAAQTQVKWQAHVRTIKTKTDQHKLNKQIHGNSSG